MATKFRSRVVRCSEMGGKVVVEFKEKYVVTDNQEPQIDSSDVEMFDKVEEAERAIEKFLAEGK